MDYHVTKISLNKNLTIQHYLSLFVHCWSAMRLLTAAKRLSLVKGHLAYVAPQLPPLRPISTACLILVPSSMKFTMEFLRQKKNCEKAEPVKNGDYLQKPACYM